MGCGLWPGLGWTVGKRGLGRFWATFWWFFHFFGVKKNFKFFFENTIASALKNCIIPFWPRKHEKNTFFRAKNLSVNTWRSGPDFCSHLWLYSLNWVNLILSNFIRFRMKFKGVCNRKSKNKLPVILVCRKVLNYPSLQPDSYFLELKFDLSY